MHQLAPTCTPLLTYAVFLHCMACLILLQAAEEGSASLSRSLAHSSSIMGSSFVAGHSMFNRQVTMGRSTGRGSLEHTPSKQCSCFGEAVNPR
jgi:uncharacterized membrane protein YhhN